MMRAVRISPKFEVTIPIDVRRSMDLKPGMRFRVREFKYGIELVPIGRKRRSWGIRRRMVAGGANRQAKGRSESRKRP